LSPILYSFSPPPSSPLSLLLHSLFSFKLSAHLGLLFVRLSSSLSGASPSSPVDLHPLLALSSILSSLSPPSYPLLHPLLFSILSTSPGDC
jgi:hypothetical protein